MREAKEATGVHTSRRSGSIPDPAIKKDDMRPYDREYNPTNSGVFEIPEADYFKINAINNSGFKIMANYSPRHLKCDLDGLNIGKPTSREQQKKFDFGSAVDLSLFEPERFAKEVVEAPGINKNTKAYKAWAAEQSGKYILSHQDYKRALGTVKGIWKKDCARQLLESGFAQRVVLWKHPVYGFWCKARTDWIHAHDQPITVDLKTTEKAVLNEFRWIARRLKYYWQAHWYTWGLTVATGLRHDEWRWIVAETWEPHETIVYKPDNAGIDEAAYEIDDLCEQYAQCLDTDVWPGYPDRVMSLSNDYTSPQFSDDIQY